MRASLKTSISLTLAALALGLGLAASATSASAHMPPHFGGGHFGHFGHWGHGYGFGFVDSGYGDGYDSCIRFRPVFDSEGNFLGRRPVNVCD